MIKSKTFSFQAYIPKSLGKSLTSYFLNDRRFKDKILSNQTEFIKFLNKHDQKGFNWIPEPIIGCFTKTFFSTDDCEFHESHKGHSVRLSIEGILNFSKAGEYSFFEIQSAFQDNCRGSKKYNHQHSGESHKIMAYISDESFIDTGSTFVNPSQFRAFFKEYDTDTSIENPLKITYENTESGNNLWTTGSQRKILDTTIIHVSASAGYPYLAASPNIDFDLKITINKNGARKVEGNHNRFPAYELLMNDQVVYRYNPADFGFTGPDPYNLNSSKAFSYFGR